MTKSNDLLALPQISLPPLVLNEKSRQNFAETLRVSRERYRTFRTNLSREVRESKGKPLRQTLSVIAGSRKKSNVAFLHFKFYRKRLEIDLLANSIRGLIWT